MASWYRLIIPLWGDKANFDFYPQCFGFNLADTAKRFNNSFLKSSKFDFEKIRRVQTEINEKLIEIY